MPKHYFSVVLFFFFIESSIVFGQDINQADSLFNISRFSEAENIYLSVREQSILNQVWSTLAYTNIRIADIIRINGGNRLAIKLLEENDSMINNYAHDTQLITKNLIAKAEAYYNISELGVFKSLVDSSLRIKLKTYSENSPELAEELLHLGRYYLNVTDFEGMLEYAKKARVVIQSNEDLQLPRIYNLIGYSFHTLHVYDSALIYYDSAKWALAYQGREDKLMLSKIYQNTGNTYNDLIRYNPKINLNKALINYDKAIEISKAFSSPAKLAVFYFIIQYAYHRASMPDSSLIWIDKGIRALAPNANIMGSQEVESLEQTLDDSFFLLLLVTKARRLKAKYEATQNIDYLIASTKYYKYQFLFHQYLVANSNSDFETLRMYALYDYGVIGAYLENVYLLNQLDGNSDRLYEAFELIGMDKYGLTFKNLLKEYSDSKDSDYHDFLLNEEINKLGINTQTLKMLEKYINKSSSGLHETDIKIEDSRPMFDSLYSKISDDGVLIDYNSYWRSLLVFVLSKDSLSLHRIKLSDSIKSNIKNINKAMLANNPKSYYAYSSLVADELIAPVYSLLKAKKSWIIISESQLGSIPFEALPVPTFSGSVTDFKSIDYLVNHHAISYALTAHSIIYKMEKVGLGVLGFSPSFKNETELSSLPFSTTLLNDIRSTLKGNYYFDKEATRKRLFNPKENPKILHLASHFKLNEKYPELTDMYCYDAKGELSTIKPLDILGLPYTPELTILSGCETGVGKSFVGEGSLSFGRYFMKLGSPSIVTTLWEVDDKASKDVLALFYKYLAQGLSKNMALHEAKMEYLALLNEHQTANPINWAGYVLIGNYDPIKLDRKLLWWGISWWYYMLGLILISTSLFIFKSFR